MQLLVAYSAADPVRWRADFDARAESRAQAGLTLLQIWHDADDATAILCLLELHDRARAEAWLQTEGALHGARGPRYLEIA